MSDQRTYSHDEIDRLHNATAYGSDGEKIGSVANVYLDDDTGEASWVSVTTGWFGTSQSFVPLQGSTYERDGDLRVPYTKDQVKDAPRVDADGHLSPEEESRLYSHYSLDSTRRVADVDHDRLDRDVNRDGDRDEHVDRDVRGDVHRDDAQSVTRSEERLKVGTEEVQTGRARLRKYVTTEEQTVTVPVQREVLSVERTPIADGERRGDAITDTGEQVEEIVLREERPVVDKETVAVEEVSVGKDVVTEEHQVTEQVAKEHVDVDTEGDLHDTDTDLDDSDRRRRR